MKGFTKVDNELLEHILTSDLTKRQLKILLLIIRFSHGYQKSYAILRKNDFSYAGVSPYCIKGELTKLARMRVIHWNPASDTVRIKLDLGEWAVDKPVKNPGDKLRKFFKIATKNSMKQQHAIYQNSNISFAKLATPNNSKEKKKFIKKEELFLKVLRDYFLGVAPLTESEMFILRQVVESFPLRAIEQAIGALSAGSDRSFSNFLKALDGFTAEARRDGTTSSLKTSLQRFWRRHPSQ